MSAKSREKKMALARKRYLTSRNKQKTEELVILANEKLTRGNILVKASRRVRLSSNERKGKGFVLSFFP